jgi:Histidine kinase-like ATPase domain
MLSTVTHGNGQDPNGPLPARRPGAAVQRVLHASFPGVPLAVSEARRQAANALAGVPVAEDAVFCLGEVATNAVVHSRSGRPGGQFTVTADVLAGALVVLAVADEGGRWTGREADSYPHGLEIVRALAAYVRADGDDNGRTVWVALGWERS